MKRQSAAIGAFTLVIGTALLLLLPEQVVTQTAGSFVILQGSVPGTVQSGHVNVSGTATMGNLVTPTAAIANLTGNVTVWGKLTGSGQAQFAGEVGLSTAPVPGQRITMLTPTHAKGLVQTDGNITLATWVGGGTPAGLIGTNSNHPLGFVTNGGTKMYIATGGNVGIGTDAPADKFTVQTANPGFGITHTDGSILLSSYLGSGMGWMGTRSNHPLALFANNGQPSLKVDTDGRIYCTKRFRVDSQIFALAADGWGDAGQFISAVDGGVGIYGAATSNGQGVFGANGNSTTGYAVYSQGRLICTGTKAFRIDHPLDPANKALNHYCTEGPAPYNAYKGRVQTDARGYAWIELPNYYESINRDPDYQLTVIDNSDEFVLAKVVSEVIDNRFRIRTSKPKVVVCWEVKATRDDPYVRTYGAPVEVEKGPRERGKYQHPELYGMSEDLRFGPKPEVTHEPNLVAQRPAR